jgi:hypothetical protein
LKGKENGYGQEKKPKIFLLGLQYRLTRDSICLYSGNAPGFAGDAVTTNTYVYFVRGVGLYD